MLRLRRLASSDKAFKTVHFKDGLNVILADREERSRETDTLNGAGKTSIVELVHFLLGGDWEKTREDALREDVFSLECELQGKRLTVSRSGGNPGRVFFSDLSETDSWPIQPDTHLILGPSMKVAEWGAVLGQLVFGLPASDAAEPFRPAFRGLFNYFARRVRSGGFHDPEAIHKKQALWDQQVAITYLLGLDWTIPQQMEKIRAKNKFRQQLKKMLAEEEGLEAKHLLPSSAEIRTRLTLSERRVNELRKALGSFRVAEEYHTYEREVDELTATLSALSNENSADRQLATELERALAIEAPPDSEDLGRVYAEAGLVLPAEALKRFDDVRAFHDSVIRNRRVYLQGELQAARARISDREDRMKHADARRSTLMQTLRTHGALESYTRLTEELGRHEADSQHLRTQYERAVQLEDTGRELVVAEAQLGSRLAQNQLEQAEQIERATVVFAEISQQLYSRPGRLVVNNRLVGAPISIWIPKGESEGVLTMQIFCFDLTIATLTQERGIGPAFTMHDSHMFDGVDVRQIRQGLEVARDHATRLGRQYITMVNSDIAADVEEEGLSLNEFVIPPRLSDQPDGGLFGRPFGEEQTHHRRKSGPKTI